MISQIAGQKVFEALFIVGLGVIWGFDFWWPGLLMVFGAAYGIALLLRRRYWPGAGVAIFFLLLPAAYVFTPTFRWLLPLAVVGLGVTELARALRMEAK